MPEFITPPGASDRGSDDESFVIPSEAEEFLAIVPCKELEMSRLRST
jgi:hypothetical protein